MWLYLNGSESGLRQNQSLLAHNYLILIDLNGSRMRFVPYDYTKHRPPQASESDLNPSRYVCCM